MSLRIALIGGLVLGMLASSAAAGDPAAAAEAFAKGKALLAAAQFEPALEAFKAAAKADEDNSSYFQECVLLKRVINLRAQFPTEQDAGLQQQIGAGLYAYYKQYHINPEALSIAQALHAKQANAESAGRVAEAQLDLGDNAAALAIVEQLPAAERTPRVLALQGIALARLGRTADANAIADEFKTAESQDAELAFDAARLCALQGRTELALAWLRVSFEATPPSWLEPARADAKACPDLKALVESSDFAKVCATESKVKAGCGGCANKAGCASKDKAGCKDHTAKEGAAGEKSGGCEHEKH